ncbi:MAG: O-antigen ligase family protein [bacterium]
MLPTNHAGAVPEDLDSPRIRIARVAGTLVFVLLLVLTVFTAIPYGTAEVWWKAFFICAVFSLAILWSIDGFLSNAWMTNGRSIILPIAALVVFSFLQTISLGKLQLPSIASPASRTVSLDSYETRFFALQLSAIGLFGIFLFRYLTTVRRLRLVIHLVIAIAVASAIFGIVRQTTQHDTGFVLPLLHLEQGYGQFINRNHFAFLMEMALGLILGLILGGGVRREQVLAYFAMLLPIWTALVLSGSRGGLIAMLAEILVAAFLLSGLLQNREVGESQSRILDLLRSRSVRIGLFLVLVFGVVFGTLYLGGEHLASRIEATSADFSAAPSELRQGVSRNEIWTLTYKIIAAHPVLGVGMGAYWVAVPEFHDAAGTFAPQEAHSDYLELLASGGLVGIAIGIWFLTAVGKKIKTNLRSHHRVRRAACLGATIGIASVAVHSIVDFGLHMIVNALVFTTLIVIATSEQPWHTDAIRES